MINTLRIFSLCLSTLVAGREETIVSMNFPISAANFFWYFTHWCPEKATPFTPFFFHLAAVYDLAEMTSEVSFSVSVDSLMRMK